MRSTTIDDIAFPIADEHTRNQRWQEFYHLVGAMETAAGSLDGFAEFSPRSRTIRIGSGEGSLLLRQFPDGRVLLVRQGFDGRLRCLSGPMMGERVEDWASEVVAAAMELGQRAEKSWEDEEGPDDALDPFYELASKPAVHQAEWPTHVGVAAGQR